MSEADLKLKLDQLHNGKDNGERKLITTLDDIYSYKNELQSTVKSYELAKN